MEKSKLIETVNKCIDLHKKHNEEMAQLSSLTGATSDRGIFDTTSRLFEAFIENIDYQYGGSQGWLSWYIYDNDFGNSGFTVKIDKKEIKVDSVEKLVEVMIDSHQIWALNNS